MRTTALDILDMTLKDRLCIVKSKNGLGIHCYSLFEKKQQFHIHYSIGQCSILMHKKKVLIKQYICAYFQQTFYGLTTHYILQNGILFWYVKYH